MNITNQKIFSYFLVCMDYLYGNIMEIFMNMAKKKKTTNQQTFLSPEQYIRERARTLEIGDCYINENYKEHGLGHIIVTRLHKGGKKTIGCYLVDTYCLGVKDAFCRARMEDYEYDGFINDMEKAYHLKKISYNEAHNLIYGSIEFADEAGIAPCKDFTLAKYILEEDTEAIPLIEYEYGRNGKHLLIVSSHDEADRYMPTLRANLGTNFNYIIKDKPFEEDEPEVEDLFGEDFAKRLADFEEKHKNAVKWNQPYSYKHPQYPVALEVENPSVLLTISDPKNAYLSDTQVDEILSLPHDSLRRDLESILLFNIGLSCDGIPEEMSEGQFSGVIGHCVMLLGEVGNDSSSLDAVLEVLRQNNNFLDYHIADSSMEIIVPTIYKLAKNKLDVLMEFMMENGLENFWKFSVANAVAQIAFLEPDKRPEIIVWFKDLLTVINRDFPSATYTDAMLNGSIVSNLININASELLPEIKTMYDNGFVDLMVCGDYSKVEKSMIGKEHSPFHKIKPDIKERYGLLRKFVK